MSKRSNAEAFLANMSGGVAVETPAPAAEPIKTEVKKAIPPSIQARKSLMHFGGYCDRKTREKAALLRIRLDLDNSELITRAIDELFNKHEAERAFDGAN